MNRSDAVWKAESLVRTFIEEVRGGIPFAAEQIEVMRRLIAACGLPVTRFADLGCGSGVLAKALLAWHPRAESTLVDFSEPMIGAARRELGGHAPAPRFVVADLGTADWLRSVEDRKPFDIVVSGYAIHHLPDDRKRELYHEIFTLLVPGGMFLNIEHVASPTTWIEEISDDMLVDSLHAFHKSQGSEKDRDQVAHEFVHRPDKAANVLAPVEVQCDWLRGLGFDDVDCYFKVFELAVFGGRRPQ